MLSWNWQKILLEVLAIGGLGGGMAGGAVSGSGNILEEDAYELEDGSSWDARFSLLKAQQAESVGELRKFKEFNGSEFGAGEYRAEGPEAPFYYLSDWGENKVNRHQGVAKVTKTTGMNRKEELIENSKSEDIMCDLNAGRQISNNCGGYGSRKLASKLDDNIDFDGGKKLEEMVSYVSANDAEGIERLGKERSVELEEELFGIFKGRDFWVSVVGTGRDGRLDLTINHLSDLVTFLGKGKNILNLDGNQGEVIEGRRLKIASGKTKTIGRLLKGYGNKASEGNTQEKNKDWMLMQAIGNFLNGVEGDLGYVCEQGVAKEKNSGDEPIEEYFPECEKSLQGGRSRVARVLKSVWTDNGKLYVPIEGTNDGGHNQKGAFKRGNSINLYFFSLGGSEPRKDILEQVITETCTENGEEPTALLGLLIDNSPKIRSELCKEIIKPGFGDNVSNKRVCYFKFKDGPQNYLRRGNFLNGMVKIPVGYKNADGYGAKCSVHGI